MRIANFLVLGTMTLLLIGCTEEIVSPIEIIESPSPDKLSPYGSFFDLTTLEQRRDALIHRMPANAFAVITTNGTYLRNGDVDFEFRPASTFYYLTEGDKTVSPAYRGIAARIEDTVLITTSGAEVMSSTLPWSIFEIETLMQ